jgi:hypothetical protein
LIATFAASVSATGLVDGNAHTGGNLRRRNLLQHVAYGFARPYTVIAWRRGGKNLSYSLIANLHARVLCTQGTDLCHPFPESHDVDLAVVLRSRNAFNLFEQWLGS